MIPIETTETVQVQQVIEQPVQIVGAVPFQMHFDGTDTFAVGGVAIIKAKLIGSDGSAIADRTFLFKGEYYANKIAGPVNAGMTHREDFNATIAQVIAEVYGDEALRNSLIETGQLVIDPAMRFNVIGL